MSFTKGPWTNREGTIFAGEIPVAGIIWDVTTPQEQPHNAALIAAAPEMYEMLQDAAETLETGIESGDLPDNVVALTERLNALLARLEEK